MTIDPKKIEQWKALNPAAMDRLLRSDAVEPYLLRDEEAAIRSMCEAVPALLAEVERLRALLARATAAGFSLAETGGQAEDHVTDLVAEREEMLSLLEALWRLHEGSPRINLKGEPNTIARLAAFLGKEGA